MFYKVLFEPKINISNVLTQDYLHCTEILKLTQEQPQKNEEVITKEEPLKFLEKIPNNRLPGNDGITKEFYKAFWDELKTPFLSVNKAFKVGELSNFQK